jgi:transcriptional regulator with XRE-family HTH domain
MAERSQPEEDRAETLGQIIRAKREARGWSQATLAEKVNVTVVTVSRWECNKSFPRGDDVRLALIEALGLPKKTFFLWKEKELAKRDEEASFIVKGEEDEEVSPVEMVKELEGTSPLEVVKEDQEAAPVEMILPHPYWNVPLPSPEEIEAMEMVEYRIPPIVVYRGFYVQVPGKYGGYLQERRVTSNGKPLLPYDTWVKPETVVYGWGYTGAGPRHLAQSILLDYFEIMYPDEQENVLRSLVNKYYFNFKMDFTAWFDKSEWEIWSGAITAWLEEERKKGDPAPNHTLDDIQYGWRGWWKRWDRYKGT